MQQKQTPILNHINPFESLTEEIIFTILDCLSSHPQSTKSFSLTSKSFLSLESRHRKTLTLLTPNSIHRYTNIGHLDLTRCPRIDDASLTCVARAYSATLRSVDLSRSRFFTHLGLSTLVAQCGGLVELDLSNAMEMGDQGAAAVAEARNLEKLWMGRCILVSDIGIGCIAVGCKKLKVVCLRWCVTVTDLGVGLVASKCREISSLDLS